MAHRAATEARIHEAYEELLKHRATHRVVAELAERWGVSARQARRIVGKAHEEMSKDMDHIERPVMLAKAIYALETVVERSLVTGNLNATIGATRTLAEMLNLSIRPDGPPYRASYTGRRYG